MRTIHLLLLGLVLCTFTFLNVYISLNRIQNCSQCNYKKGQIGESKESVIYFITPTYARHVQKAELTRISHTLLLVKNIHWIVVEDSENRTENVAKLLRKVYDRQIYSFKFTHLNMATPSNFKTNQADPNWLKPRGVWQRNAALQWLRKNNHLVDNNGVVYFGDDDNTYDLELFDEIRSTQKVSVFPVGLVGGLLVEKPLVKNQKVTGFNSVWKRTRTYPIDMAGFAVSVNLILKKTNVMFSENVQRGYQETHLLKQLIGSPLDLEPKAGMCRLILVWHTRTETPKLNQERKLSIPSNFGMLDN